MFAGVYLKGWPMSPVLYVVDSNDQNSERARVLMTMLTMWRDNYGSRNAVYVESEAAA